MNSILGKYINFEDLKQVIGMGLIVGFVLGVAEGLLFIISNRYLEFEMYNIAFSYFRYIVNYFSLIFPFISLISFIMFLVLSVILIAFLKDTEKGKKYTNYIIIGIILIGLFVFAGYQLNKSSWYPPFSSVYGYICNMIVTLLFAFLGFIILKRLHDIQGFLSHVIPKISRLRFSLYVIFLLLMLNSFFYYHQLQKDKNGLNVLFITVDTLRADHLGCYSYVRDTSPNIDKLANEGILFSSAVAQWPKTSPSFASMFTSTYGYYNGVMRHTGRQKIRNRFVLLAEVLRNAGYKTFAVTTNPGAGTQVNINQGFDTFIQTWEEIDKPLRPHKAVHVTNYALSWLKDNSSKGKFFMWLHYMDPHAPYAPPEPYSEMYVGDKYYDGSRKAKLNPGRTETIGGIPAHAHLGTRNEIDYYIAQYDAQIRYTDENIGKALDAVKAMGLSDNTIIIFTSDHGESLGEHNYYTAHGLLPYDDCVRVPLIIKIPGLKSEVKVIDQPVELINIVPTILDILNIPVNKEAQGKSLVPLMLGDGNNIPKYAFTEAGYQLDYQRVIRTKKWKLIFIPDEEDKKIMQGMPFELYDIENDPRELNNLINVEPKVADELKVGLFKWMELAKGTSGSVLSEEADIDKETKEILKSLGYLQ